MTFEREEAAALLNAISDGDKDLAEPVFATKAKKPNSRRIPGPKRTSEVIQEHQDLLLVK